MNNSISRLISEIVWLGIRILGTFLLMKGLLPLMGELLLDTLQKPDSDNFPPSLENQLREQFRPNIAFGYITLISYCAIGLYLLFFGKAFHTLLTRTPLVDNHQVTAPNEQEEPSTKDMQRLYREFMTSEGSTLPPKL